MRKFFAYFFKKKNRKQVSHSKSMSYSLFFGSSKILFGLNCSITPKVIQ
jgi:hypothetical protein